MPKAPHLVFAFTLTCILVPQVASAQGLMATLVGTVKDEQGGVMPDALVTISSRALIGGPVSMMTNDRGQLRFQALPPGPYLVVVERQGFAPYREENIVLGAGATIDREVVLKLQGIAEAIVVAADGPRIEARGSGFESRFDRDYIRAIPGRRFSMFDFIKAAPGISPTMSSGSVTAFSPSSAVSAFGSNVNENAFLLDGTNFTCPCTGGAIAEPGVDVIQEVQVQSVGASAEFGNMQGAVFNVITKQGSNVLEYDASYYGQPARLTSGSVRRPVPNGSQAESGFVRVKYHDFTTNLGGPILRDRLWFFGGYEYLRDFDSQPGTDPVFPRKYEQDKVLGKFTWQIAPSLRVLSSFHNEVWANPERPTLVTPFETTLRFTGSVPTSTFAHVTYTPSSNTLWEARAGQFVLSQNNAPSSGDRTTPNRFDRVTGVSSGGPQGFGELKLVRTTAKATLTHYASALSADHEWKVGAQVEDGKHHAFSVVPSGTRFTDNNGQPFQAIARPPATFGGRFVTAGAFVSESMTLGDRVTFNGGLRFDHSRAISQDLPAPDVEGRETGGAVAGLGTIYTWNVWSPRLGMTTKLTADGQTMLRASFGIFHQGMLTAELGGVHPGQTPITTTAFDPATGGYTRTISILDPKINLLLDPQTRSPRTDEYSISVDRQIGRRFSAAVAYVRKNGRDFIGWTDTGGIYRAETRVLPDGRSIPVFILSNSPGDRRFLLTNPSDYSLRYDGIVFAAEKRQSHGWQGFASYTFSTTSGLLPSSGAAAGDVQAGSTFGTRPFGRDPNSLTSAQGQLPNDRPHMFRAAASVAVPRTGFVVAANLQSFSGKPWAASAQLSLPQGDQRVLLETPGTRRLSAQTLLDLRLSRVIGLSDAVRVELLLDVLNALNRATAEGLATDNFFSPNFGQSTVFLEPRRVMMAVRLNVGR
jgi:Carboxypeptidase regulatory-like domain/TonB dependent receptor-like, beta-barrel